MFECQYCNKVCKNNNSLKQHEIRCKCNPNRRAFNHLAQYIQENRKGKTKYDCKEIQKQVTTLKQLYASGQRVSHMKGKPGTFKGKHHSEESKKQIGSNVSKTRKAHYADGTITPAKGVGRGKYSYIIANNTRYMCRSTYEFIFALYLLNNGIEFNMENVRVPAASKNRYASTFISDFDIGKIVIEVKGIRSGKDKYIREAFEASGYSFIELYESDIMKCKGWLKQHDVPIDELLSNVVEGHNKRKYYTYRYS